MVACATLLVYDHLCTFDQEVALVWSSNPLQRGSIFFIVNRYLPYVDTLMSLNLHVVSLYDPQAYRSLRYSHYDSPWIKQMYKDGLLYYVLVLAVSIANVLVAALAPRPLANWLATPQRVIHSVLCNKVLLQILRQRTRASNVGTESSLTISAFRIAHSTSTTITRDQEASSGRTVVDQ
ncbi:hypothetical protein AGABI1DRAFT_126386 [Agaricus bisporus var. burnettii JB137-S8]|uniref:DUF6533 domain-containing protein n=1 Tax=Agaricus bisporus var. burnettii (strain JB137-S8 / ATCC MYA-4627 / FGSC 10392) TaxID=597362 RepID=K5X2J5_AGABU|nr:uncharacterized protein AGABI1DRAFT_126386 [Agaricus bisporus var. burnettii JB137-S8]EKM82036.1 hypothetical protein AGABI1DRAFT_126386 [Agaricus bisporus var. burnettii JB137-S8]